MVQGTSYDHSSKVTPLAWDKASKKFGYEAIQKIDQEKKAKELKDPWGTTFKNRENFVNMHLG